MIYESQPGRIYCEQAYAQGKMLDSSGWDGFLPRGITPSDIDHVFDNNGQMIFMEVTSRFATWEELESENLGQWLLYRNLILSCRRPSVAVLWLHDTPHNLQIDTLRGCVSFSVLSLCRGDLHRTTPLSGDRWPDFVWAWFTKTRQVLLYLRDGQQCQIAAPAIVASPPTTEEENDGPAPWDDF